MAYTGVLLFLLFCLSDGSGPNRIYPVKGYRQLVGTVKNGKKYVISTPDDLPFTELHLFGTATERGLAQGQLMADTIMTFVEKQLPDFYREEVDQIPLGGLPVWLQKLIQNALRDEAPAVFDAALAWVFSEQESFLNASASHILEEAEAMAHGVCAEQTVNSSCHQSSLAATIKHVNMLPELIRMQCSMMGAWGDATPSGSLVQLRTLDFGTGPFANQTFLVVNHPPAPAPAFAVFSFPAFVGAVTGFSQKVGLSEKVDDVTGGLRPIGTYKGQAVTSVIRDILEFASSKEEAVNIAIKASRTWSVWLGFGDFASQKFLAVTYEEKAVIPFDDVTLPFVTNQMGFPHVVYIDKHPQPSTHPDMPALVEKYYGNMSAVNIVQNFPRLMQSGDVHVAAYDFGAKKAFLARGVNDATGDFTRLACDSPFLEFDMEDLWAEALPTV